MQAKQELELFRRICGDFQVVFDVGARTDDDYCKIRKCEYHFFEPNPEFADDLEIKVKSHNLPKYVINMFGLSDTEEELDYYENTQSLVKHWQGISGESVRKLPVKRLDGYGFYRTIDFLKVDCEQMDHRVICGGAETIKRVRYIQCEFVEPDAMIQSLSEFNLYFILEPQLVKFLNTKWCFPTDCLIPAISNLPFFKKEVLPTGNGVNIFGIRASMNVPIEEINFKL